VRAFYAAGEAKVSRSAPHRPNCCGDWLRTHLQRLNADAMGAGGEEMAPSSLDQ